MAAFFAPPCLCGLASLSGWTHAKGLSPCDDKICMFSMQALGTIPPCSLLKSFANCCHPWPVPPPNSALPLLAARCCGNEVPATFPKLLLRRHARITNFLCWGTAKHAFNVSGSQNLQAASFLVRRAASPRALARWVSRHGSAGLRPGHVSFGRIFLAFFLPRPSSGSSAASSSAPGSGNKAKISFTQAGATTWLPAPRGVCLP